eukprot:TRINITY_DN4920_c0_g3_i5.p1 TRINITY_DN4920_c0_g3~~TRINITY_DN4920_c0_g3_i5.p1  ORF type:complete len:256 (+),score=38.29 TRINITY_DN4920_c0_g3_i5:442-1209(+)
MNEKKQNLHAELYKKFMEKAKSRYKQLVELITEQQRELKARDEVVKGGKHEKKFSVSSKQVCGIDKSDAHFEANISELVAQKDENEQLEKELVINTINIDIPVEYYNPKSKLLSEIASNPKEKKVELSKKHSARVPKLNRIKGPVKTGARKRLECNLRSTARSKDILLVTSERSGSKTAVHAQNAQKKPFVLEYIAPIKFKSFEKINRTQNSSASKRCRSRDDHRAHSKSYLKEKISCLLMASNKKVPANNEARR